MIFLHLRQAECVKYLMYAYSILQGLENLVWCTLGDEIQLHPEAQ